MINLRWAFRDVLYRAAEKDELGTPSRRSRPEPLGLPLQDVPIFR